MKIFNTFYVLRVRLYRGDAGIPGQSEAQSDVRANRSRVIIRTDDGREVEE